MKRIFTIILVALGVFANAQSLRLFQENGTVNNNDTIVVAIESEEIETYLGYENLTNQDLNFFVKKEIISNSNPDNAMILFCVGECYTGNQSLQISLEANKKVEITDNMAFHSQYLGSPAEALVKYTFYLADNEEDCVIFYIKYTDGVGIRQVDMVKSLNAYPNPATNNVTINYATPGDDSYLVIKNLAGKEVYRSNVSSTGKKSIDLNSYSAGVYFYGVESDGKMICTKKLLVK